MDVKIVVLEVVQVIADLVAAEDAILDATLGAETHVEAAAEADAILIVHLAQDVQETAMVLVLDALDAEALVHLDVKDVALVAMELVKINAEQAIVLQHAELTVQHHAEQMIVKEIAAVAVKRTVQQTVNQVALVDVLRLADLIAREPQHNRKEEHINGRIKRR